MEEDRYGNLIFTAIGKDNKKREVYIFNKDNYNKHCLKHNISGEEGLKHIEETFKDPDCITIGNGRDQKNYYKVVNYQKNKNSISVSVCFYKSICYKKKIKGKKIFYKIATVLDSWSPNYQVVNNLEKEIWKKISSLI